MRANEPVQAGHLRLEGFTIYYEIFGDAAAPPLLLLPAWQIVHRRIWKMQVPFLARRFRVITFDSPGNGGGERTEQSAAFEFDRITEQAIGLLDYLGVARADVVGFSRGCAYGLLLAAYYPERVNRLILISTAVGQSWAAPPRSDFWERHEDYQGWDKYNGHYWLEHYPDWLSFFFGEIFSEPHSTKPIDDCMSWGLETSPEILVRTVGDPTLLPQVPVDEFVARIRCPVLVIHGDEDRRAPIQWARDLVELRPDWSLVTLEGSGHVPLVREPVKVNQEISGFLGEPQPTRRTWRRALARRNRRALFVSSPIGLGHVQRDLAIARELRCLIPDLEIDWLAQAPVTQVLMQAGEHIHPMSRFLASECAHWESMAGEHELHCFYAFREMDEILLANFMVFLDVVRETPYDLWIGDEAWEVDHYLHENPELKTAPYAFLTDFLGWLPIDRSSGSREAELTADYNSEMIEHVARFSRVRDRALYFGDYDDLPPERFGPGLPSIRDWAREHFTATGYVAPFDPASASDPRVVRQRLGYDPERPLIIFSVGGTTAGRHLLHKGLDAWPLIHRERPDAQGIVVAGPRISRDDLPARPGLEIRDYVHDLYQHLAVADLAVAQGGLSTTMELTISRRPFLYFPLKDHCEQVYHVAHRLDRHRAGRRLDFQRTTPEALAEEALSYLGAGTGDYRQVEPGAGMRAAALLADLL